MARARAGALGVSLDLADEGGGNPGRDPLESIFGTGRFGSARG